MSGEHCPIPPSSAHIWRYCPGSIQAGTLAPTIERDDTPAREGTIAHDVGALLIRNGLRAGVGPAVPEVASNGVPITPEIRASAEMYAGTVLAVMRNNRIAGGPHIGVETQVSCPDVHRLSYGTVDSWLYVERRATLHVWDFKNGRVPVEARNNWQLINYVSGLLDQLNLVDTETRVIVTIIQPHDYGSPIKRWEFLASDIRGQVNQLATAAREALEPNPRRKAGKHCRRCPVRLDCPAALDYGLGIYDTVAGVLPVDLDPSQLGAIMITLHRAQEHIGALVSGYEARVSALIKSGQTVPGYRLKESRGREAWALDAATVTTMGAAMGIDLARPGVITPKQARDAGFDTEGLTERPSRGVKLVQDDGEEAKRIFSQPIKGE